MTQGPFSERGKRPLLFMPFFGKQARKGGIHGERTAGGISGAVPHGSSQRRHQPGVGTDLRHQRDSGSTHGQCPAAGWRPHRQQRVQINIILNVFIILYFRF